MARPSPALIRLILTALAFGLSCQNNPDLPRFAGNLKAEHPDSLARPDSPAGRERERVIAWLDGDPARWNLLFEHLHENP